jgi:hypothetical protein
MAETEISTKGILMIFQFGEAYQTQVCISRALIQIFHRRWFLNSIIGYHYGIRLDFSWFVSLSVIHNCNVRLISKQFLMREAKDAKAAKDSKDANETETVQMESVRLRLSTNQPNYDIICQSYFLLVMSPFASSEFGGLESGEHSTNRILVLKKEEEQKDFLFGCENHHYLSEVEGFRRVLGMSGGSNFGSEAMGLRCDSSGLVEIDPKFEIIDERYFLNWKSLKEIVFLLPSRVKEICGFKGCTSLRRLEIPSSVEVISYCGFNGCTSLNELIFSSDSHVREIGGFNRCTSLCRVEIPSSVEVIGFSGSNGFDECTSLNELIFSSDSHMKEIHGFNECASLFQIEIPSSVELVSGFQKCHSLRFAVLRPRTHLKNNEGFRLGRPFLVYDNDDVNDSRRLLHLGIFSCALRKK